MRPILIVAVLLFTALTFYSALWFKSEDIQADITKRVTEDLETADAEDISIDVDGRHVTLSGIVYDPTTETGYLETANRTYGALGPIDGLTLQTGSGFLKAVKSSKGITLSGAVPSDAARAALLEAAADSTDGDVVDAMTVGAAAGAWTDEAGFGLGQLALLKEGALSVAPDSYTLSGVTDGNADTISAPLADRAGWQSFVSTPLLSASLSADLDAVKGEVSGLQGTVATLNGDVADRDGAIKALTAERDTLATSLTDMTQARDTALEQRDTTTAEVIADRDGLAQKLTGLTAARDVLSQTVTGLAAEREELAQSVATLTGERDTAVTDLTALRASLDDTQSSTAALRGELSETQAQLAARDTTIDSLNTQLGVLQAEVTELSGQLESQVASLNTGQQEDATLRAQIAGQATTIETLTADVEARGDTIVRLQGELDAQDEAKAAAMAQIADLDAQMAAQSDTRNQTEAQAAALSAQLAEQTDAAKQALAQVDVLTDEVAQLQAEGADLSALVAERSALIEDLRSNKLEAVAPAGATEMAAQCSARAGEILQTAQINFSSGTADIRNTSMQTLERLTGIALACADSGLIVEIGGHTDSQGSDANNQNLSERRAQAVARFMMDRGVPTGTLSPVGFGETQPVGDNTTLDGRQQNRRISFEWQAR